MAKLKSQSKVLFVALILIIFTVVTFLYFKPRETKVETVRNPSIEISQGCGLTCFDAYTTKIDENGDFIVLGMDDKEKYKGQVSKQYLQEIANDLNNINFFSLKNNDEVICCDIIVNSITVKQGERTNSITIFNFEGKEKEALNQIYRKIEALTQKK